MNIVTFNTRDGNETRVGNVPATTIEGAAILYCEKMGWTYIKATNGTIYGAQKVTRKQVQQIEAGELDELNGLFQIYENDDRVVDFTQIQKGGVA